MCSLHLGLVCSYSFRCGFLQVCGDGILLFVEVLSFPQTYPAIFIPEMSSCFGFREVLPIWVLCSYFLFLFTNFRHMERSLEYYWW